MLRLNAPLWLRAARQGDGPVPEPAGVLELSPVARQRLALARVPVPVLPTLVLTRSLASKAEREGHLPRDFRSILSAALAEFAEFDPRAARRPLRLVVDAGDEVAASVPYVGIAPEHVASLALVLGSLRRAALALAAVGSSFARHVGGLTPLEIGALEAALRALLGIDERGAELEVERVRDAGHRIFRLVEARVGQALPREPAAQIEAFAAALLAVHPGAQLRIEAPPRSALAFRGVAFTRHPGHGDAQVAIDAAQGERPRTLTRRALARRAPRLHGALEEAAARLERAYQDVVAFEFSGEDGSLCVESLVAADPTPLARARTAADFASRGVIDRAAALDRVRDLDLDVVLAPRLGVLRDEVLLPIVGGETGTLGVANGSLALSGPSAAAYRRAGCDVVIVVDERTTDVAVLDLAMAAGVVVIGGGVASRYAAAARRLAIPCVVAGRGRIDRAASLLRSKGVAVPEGSKVTLDGGTGALYAGTLPAASVAAFQERASLLRWRDALRGEPV
jgi:pyruvate,orthophosphate dikinase